MQIPLILLQFFIAYSIFNVWVLRYKTIAADFQQFGFPVWLRNVVGAIKLALAALVIAGIWNYQYGIIACAGIAITMFGAVAVHLKEKDPFSKLWPALGLAVLAIITGFLINHYRFSA